MVIRLSDGFKPIETISRAAPETVPLFFRPHPYPFPEIFGPNGRMSDSAESVDPDADTAFRGRLAVVATPIGNLGDLTFRALERLEAADVLLCEDTRHSLRLLRRYEIGHKVLVSVHDRNEASRVAEVIDRLRDGAAVALLSDAGMPTVSDPGYRVVRACIEAEIPVDVLPGPSAVLTALAGSGLPTDAFYFGGFLPPKSGRREKALVEALERTATSIFFESPHRIMKSLTVLASHDPDRPVCVARELTKKFETFHRGTANELRAAFEAQPRKGEMTLLVAGRSRKQRSQ